MKNRPYSKNENWAPYFLIPVFRILKRYVASQLDKNSVRDQFWRNRLFLAQGCILEAGWSSTPCKNYLYGIGLVLNVSAISFDSIKSYSTFSKGQTDTPLSSIYKWATFDVCFDTFHFTTFALLTLWRIICQSVVVVKLAWEQWVYSQGLFPSQLANTHKDNGTPCIWHQCRKTAVLSCHRFLINSGVEKMSNI